jgi:hypothetical protein
MFLLFFTYLSLSAILSSFPSTLLLHHPSTHHFRPLPYQYIFPSFSTLCITDVPFSLFLVSAIHSCRRLQSPSGRCAFPVRKTHLRDNEFPYLTHRVCLGGFVCTKCCCSCPEVTCQSGVCQAVLSGSEFSGGLGMTGKDKVVPVLN